MEISTDKDGSEHRIPPVLTKAQLFRVNPGSLPAQNQNAFQNTPYIPPLKPGQIIENNDICERVHVIIPRCCHGMGENRYRKIGFQKGYLIKRYLYPHYRDFIWASEREIDQTSFINKCYAFFRRFFEV